MYLQSLAGAFPGRPFTQPEIWDLIRTGPAIERVSRRGSRILETVLLGNSGIDSRYFAIEPPRLFTLDAQGLNENFEVEAPRLGFSALDKALDQARVKPDEIDALFVCTCTGYLCPGVSSHLAERAGLRPEATLHDVTGLGCGAAVPTLHAAACFLAANPGALVATVAVEICSAAFFLCDDPGVAVSACLFGDGASAAVWRSQPSGTGWRAHGFRSLHVPAEREKIRFVNDSGRLRNKLDRAVPAVAASAVERLFSGRTREPDAIIAHPGGRDVIDAIEQTLPQYPLEATRTSLQHYGNMSSPSVLVALEDRLLHGPSTDRTLWITGFGAGFCAYCCDLTRGEF